MGRPPGKRQDPKQPPLADDAAPLRDPRGLRPRERLFVEAYCGVANFNATKAYAIAGYKSGPQSRHNAARMTTKDHIAAAIEELRAAREQELVMDGREAKERLTLFARGNMRKFLPAADPLQTLTDDDLALIKSITPTKYGRRIELHDPVRCTELMAKIAGALKETVKVEHSLEDILAASNAGPGE